MFAQKTGRVSVFLMLAIFFISSTLYYMSKQLTQSILKTIAYFDIFSYPLTLQELYRWLWKPDGLYNFEQVHQEVMSLKVAGRIETKDGFYFLPNKDAYVNARQDAVILIKQKMQIATKAARCIRYIPFVQAMFVCNTVAGAVPNEKSDIDVFIIAKDKHLWTARLFVTLVFGLLRTKRTKTRIHNKICLSFYTTQSRLNLKDIQISKPDIYLAYWLDQLVPVYDPDAILQDIYDQNTWVHKKLPNAFQKKAMHSTWTVKPNIFSRVIHFCLSILYIEWLARYMQLKKMNKNQNSLKDLADSRVIVCDTMLKFHENDRREFFKKQFKIKCEQIGL